jgi:glycine betaine/choline ABC-type transport system substrate-binding protein
MAMAILLALALGCAATGCGGADAKENSEVTITITSRGYPEEELLREIYGQALEATGFEVRRELELRQLAPEELEAGRVSGYPDHLVTALTEATPLEPEDVPASAQAAFREAKSRFEEEGLVPFPPASFARANAVGIPRDAVEGLDLEGFSDLKGPSRHMTVIERELYCRGRAKCLGGLEGKYGIVFESFSAISSFEPSALLYKALRTGEEDAAVLIASEGELARGKDWLVLLEDDKQRLPAANAFWMTSQDAIDEAGPDYEKAILTAQKGLTLKVIRELNAAVELDGKPPGKVAAEYLDSIGYAR